MKTYSFKDLREFPTQLQIDTFKEYDTHGVSHGVLFHADGQTVLIEVLDDKWISYRLKINLN